MQLYIQTDQQIHWLSQVIARINRAYVPAKSDDSHTNMYFDPVAGRLAGKWIKKDEQNLMFSLNLKTKQFEWQDNYLKVLHTFGFFEKTMLQIEQDLAIYPESIGMKTEKIFHELHFTIPDYHIESLSSNDFSGDGVRDWMNYRQLANQACLYFLGFLQRDAEIRIWPHHFDTGIYLQLTAKFGFGFGLAMKDTLIDRPYLYLAAYSSGKQIQFNHLTDLGKGYWIIGENWKGAVLPADELNERTGCMNTEVIFQFIREGCQMYIDQNL